MHLLDFAIEAFADAGLLARPALSLKQKNIPGAIRVGEINWSCTITVFYNGSEDETDISTNHLLVKVMEGPMEKKVLPLNELIEDGPFSAWQLLGGRHLHNNLLADMYRYHCIPLDDIEPNALPDTEEALDKMLSSLGYNHVWSASSMEDDADAIVFEYQEDQDTHRYIIVTEERGAAQLSQQTAAPN